MAIVAVIAVVIAGVFFLTQDDDDDDDTASGNTTQQPNDNDDGDGDSDGSDGDGNTDGSGDTDGDTVIDDSGAGPPTEPPTGDTEFDDLAEDCYEGEMRACDELYNVTPAGSDYEEYGDTCGGRWPVSARPSCQAIISDPLPPED